MSWNQNGEIGLYIWKLWMVDIGMNGKNIVAWGLGTIGMNFMILTFGLELGNYRKLERYILGLPFENVDL